jgi:hypothetical protein
MKKNNTKAFQVVETMLASTQSLAPCKCSQGGLKNGLLTPPEAIPIDKREWLHTLIQ